jgi:hypothetical protein
LLSSIKRAGRWGYIDLEIEHVEFDNFLAVIQTQLSGKFALSTEETIEIREDEISYKGLGKC